MFATLEKQGTYQSFPKFGAPGLRPQRKSQPKISGRKHKNYPSKKPEQRELGNREPGAREPGARESWAKRRFEGGTHRAA